MYKDILTICWSIKEVNKNLTDRRSTSDYSIKYLKSACSELAILILNLGKTLPKDAIEVVDKEGHKRGIPLENVSEMLYDARKIVEFNLIDSISIWAEARLVSGGQ